METDAIIGVIALYLGPWLLTPIPAILACRKDGLEATGQPLMLSAVAFPLAFIVVSILYSMLTAAPFPRHARPHLHVRPPQSAGPYRGMVLPGELVYQDRTQQVPQGGVDQGLIRNLGGLISRVTADEPAVRVPSAHECGSCAIAHCPERMASPQCRARPTQTPQ